MAYIYIPTFLSKSFFHHRYKDAMLKTTRKNADTELFHLDSAPYSCKPPAAPIPVTKTANSKAPGRIFYPLCIFISSKFYQCPDKEESQEMT